MVGFYYHIARARAATSSHRPFFAIPKRIEAKPPTAQEILSRFVTVFDGKTQFLLDKDFRAKFIASLYLESPSFLNENQEIKEILEEFKKEQKSHFRFFHFSSHIKDNYRSLVGLIAPDEQDIERALNLCNSHQTHHRIGIDSFKKEIHFLQKQFEKEISKSDQSYHAQLKMIHQQLKEEIESNKFKSVQNPIYSITKTDGKYQITKKNPRFFYLTLSGGGVKGAGYYGVIDAIERMGFRDTLKQICGSSAGSQLATLIAFGFRSEEIEKLYKEIAFDQMTSNEAIINALNPVLVNKIAIGYKKIMHDPSLKSRLSEEEKKHIALFLTKSAAASQKPFATFKDLSILRRFKPHKYKDLLITGTCNKGELIIFSQKSSPNTPIAEAVAASCSLPVPVLTRFKPVSFGSKQIRDGGITDNTPTDYFETTATKENTLAIFFDTKDTTSRLHDHNEFFIVKRDFMQNIVDWLTGHNTYANWNSSYHRMRDLDCSAVNILYHNIGLLDFTHAKQYQENMAEYARHQVFDACVKRESTHSYDSLADLLLSMSSDELRCIQLGKIQLNSEPGRSSSSSHLFDINNAIEQILLFKKQIKFFFESKKNQTKKETLDDFLHLISFFRSKMPMDAFPSDESIANYIYKLVQKDKNILSYLKDNLTDLEEEKSHLFSLLKTKVYERLFKDKKKFLMNKVFAPAAYRYDHDSLKGEIAMRYLVQVRNLEFRPELPLSITRHLDDLTYCFHKEMEEAEQFLDQMHQIDPM